MARRLAGCAAVLLVLIAPPVRGGPRREDVEAALVYKFAQFIDWNDEASLAHDSVTVGVLGSDALLPALESALRGKSLRGRPIRVESFARAEDVRNCRILLVDVLESRQALVLGALPRRGLLTIGSGTPFVRAGGVIGLHLDDDQVKFDLNLAAAEEAGITFHAALLGLARDAGRW